MITIIINQHPFTIAPGISVAAALALCGDGLTRLSVSGAARAPLCGMGVCQECRVTINGRPHQLTCQTLCEDGMQITATTPT